MKIIDNDPSVVLTSGEADIDKKFKTIEKLLPLPKEVKHMVMNMLTYILSM